MRSRFMVGAFFALISTLGMACNGSSAGGAVVNPCASRTSSQTGHVSWPLRQVSGLTSLTAYPGVLFTHNDRGIRDSPAAGEDTTNAAVWAIDTDGTALARLRLVDAARDPIPYFDTEAISRDQAGRLVLADTGTNVDNRVVVALYRFSVSDPDHPGQPLVITPGQPFVEQDVVAQVIPLAYYANGTTSTKTKLNVESFAIDGAGDAWFIPRKSAKPYAYVATKDALNQAAGTSGPAHAVRSSQLTVAGPMTDAALSPDGTILLVKTISLVYLYDLRATTIPSALALAPACVVASGPKAKDPGHGEAIVARDDGGFTTIREGNKADASGVAAAVWSFAI